jgi:hypothetical protein
LVEGISPLNIHDTFQDTDNNTIKETSREDLEETRNVSKYVESIERPLSLDTTKHGSGHDNLSTIIEGCLKQRGEEDLMRMRDTIADEIKRLQSMFNDLNKGESLHLSTQASTERKAVNRTLDSGRFIKKKQTLELDTVFSSKSFVVQSPVTPTDLP